MNKIRINLGKGYDIITGAGFENAAGLINEANSGKKVMVVSDKTVFALYGERLVSALQKSGREVFNFVIAPGDASKNAENLFALWETLAGAGFSRGDLVVSLGGGVPGDLAGLAAATYLRGIDVVHIPTTLLAAVDSSVGGKTAINLKAGKNLAGAFHQPASVLIFPELLSTLPGEVLADGMAEVIKYSVIEPGRLSSLLNAETPDTEKIIEECVKIKKAAVEADERDGGIRRVLNFGHTAAHAAEAESGYTLTHGRAVAAGMAVITRAAVKGGLCPAGEYERLRELLCRYSLSLSFDSDADSVCKRLAADKKRSGGTVTAVVPTGGGVSLKEFSLSELEAFIKNGWNE